MSIAWHQHTSSAMLEAQHHASFGNI